MLIVGEARCAACGHDHKLTRTGVWMVCGYCLCDEQKFSARNAAREPPVTMVEPPELSADARLLLERAWTRTGEVDGSESAGGVEETSEGHADSPNGDIARRSALPGRAAEPTDPRVGPTAVAGIKPGPALSLPPSGNEMPDTPINAQACGAGGVLEQAPPAGEEDQEAMPRGGPRLRVTDADPAAIRASNSTAPDRPANHIACSLVTILERRGYLFWNCACGQEARIGVMLEGTARAAWARHAKEQ